MATISAVIITKNEEKNILRCIQSLDKVCEEIIVVDSLSTDQTEAICKSQAKVQFISSPWLGYSETKNLGNKKAQGDYILSLDADEALSMELQNEILEIKKGLDGQTAFWMPRLTSYCGHWIYNCGWRPDYQLRLFPNHKAQWNQNKVHEKLELEPGVEAQQLRHDILHYSYSSLEEHIGKINTYTSLGVDSVLKKHKDFLILRGILHGYFRFIKQYFLKSGWRDGLPGFYICSITAFMVFLKYLKAHERTKLHQALKK